MRKVILDTNVLINGVQDENSYAYRIISLCLEGEITPVISQKIRKENQLLASQLIMDEEYLNILDDYLENAEEIQVKTRKRIVEDDHEDDKFFQAAIDGSVNTIISDDHHLLDIGEYQGIKILTPQEFWHEHQRENDTGEEFQEWAKSIGMGSSQR